jgi:hypothetical protein
MESTNARVKLGFSMNQLIAPSKYRNSKINCCFLSVIVVYLQKWLGKDCQSRKPQLCCNEGKCNGPLMAHCPHTLTLPHNGY